MSEVNIISDQFSQTYANKQPNWGFNGLGYIVYKRTYARLKDDGKTEEWHETIQRCINGAQKLGAGYTKEEAEKLFDLIFNLKCNFAGRMLWQLGTPTVDRFGANSLLNCWFTTMNHPKSFKFLFENLMLGGGVGFSVRREDVHELPRVRKSVKIYHDEIAGKATKDADFIVPDSREGWIELLGKVLDSYFYTGKSFSYSTVLVRGAGELIRGFGGSASGPSILIDGITKICNVFKTREGKKLRSIDVLDINNIIGSIVVAGNVRRSAEIAIGDPDDFLFLRAKRWDLGGIPNYRAMSNNTIYCDDYDHTSEALWEGYNGNGEPYGLFNLPLSEKYGRLSDGLMKKSDLYPENRDNVVGTNPCGEISLGNFECCNLSELYLNNIETKEEALECAILLNKTQKAICAMPFIHDETNEIVHKNMRIGLGVTGVCQSMDKLSWLDFIYKGLRKFDKKNSKERGWSPSIKLTTVKPSGTLSILAGSTPGVHPAFSSFFIRRIRMAVNDSLVETCRDLGYHTEFAKNFDGTENHDTVVIEFPCKFENALLAKDTTAVKQLELVKELQTNWSDNAVSCTVYYKKEELSEIKEWLKSNYKDNVKSVSFLLHSDHGFVQAPYEEIDQEHYDRIVKRVKPIVTIQTSNEMIEGIECEGGACPIR
jgi:ribonucleoside-triphosphate reductase